MRRRFNITGLCSPERHYMVRLDDRLKKDKGRLYRLRQLFCHQQGTPIWKDNNIEKP